MALKRKSSPPPPQTHSYKYYSSDEEEQVITPVVYYQANPPQCTQPQLSVPRVNDDESETESESDYHHDPLAKYTIMHHKPSESEESFDEGDVEGKERIMEKPKLSQRIAESEPVKKKPKLLPFAATRIWSKEDEMALLRALLEYHARTGRLPSSRDYASFLSTISGSIGFPVTEKQLSNKIRMMRQNYSKKKEKGTCAKISKPHDKAIFDMSTKLFNGSMKASKKRGKEGSSSDTDTDNGSLAGVGVANGTVVDGGVAHTGDAQGRANFYFRSFIAENIRDHQLPSWLTVEDVVERFEDSMMRKMNAKIKDLSIETMKLRAKEDSMKAEFFTAIVESMAED